MIQNLSCALNKLSLQSFNILVIAIKVALRKLFHYKLNYTFSFFICKEKCIKCSEKLDCKNVVE